MSLDLDTCTERMGLWLVDHGTPDGIDRWNAVYKAMSARLAAADALVSTLLDFRTVHLERVYDLAEAYRATAPASPTSEGDET